MGLVRVLDLLNMQSFFLQNSIGQAMAKNKTKTFDYGEIKTKKAPAKASEGLPTNQLKGCFKG